LRHALRSSAKRPRAIPPDIATLTLLSLSLSLSSCALHPLSKSTHQTPAAEFPRERCASYPKIQIPILCPENSNQLGRVICPFDTPDNTRTAGPNSMSRKFQPIGEICLPFWHPGQYQNSRSQFEVPNFSTNWGELPAILTPGTIIPELQVPIRYSENLNQLWRVARHFDTPDITRTPGPNSMSRQFQPTGWSCPPLWNPGRYQNSRSQCLLVLMSVFFWDKFWHFISQNNWIFSWKILYFFSVNSTIYLMGKFSRFSISQNWGKKSRVFFLVQKFHQNAGNKYERGILYRNTLVSLQTIAKFQPKNDFFFFFQIWTPLLVW
jgi:hypothetical protein